MYLALLALDFRSLSNLMGGFAFTTLVMIFVLGVMILVHEFGHYAAAKLLGVRVEVFSLGFGKRLIGFKRGDTDYRIAALPLGGYVKMSGENPMDERTGDRAEFMSHPRWHRFIIAIAGPLMNILLAIGLLTGVYMIRYNRPAFLDGPAVVGYVDKNMPAGKADVRNGDVIARAGDKQNPNWEDLRYLFALNPNRPINLAIQRGSQILEKTLTPQPFGPNQIGEVGIDPASPVLVKAVEPGKPAQQAGLQPGDIIQAANGQRLLSVGEFLDYLKENGTKPITLSVDRNGRSFPVAVTPFEDTVEGKKVNRFGFQFDPEGPIVATRLPFSEALSTSLQRNKKYSFLILELVEKMFRGTVSVKQMSGPIGIASAAGQAARHGWMDLLELMAAISLNLGIFNLFPIPILDGGVILMLLIEGIMQRDISLRVKERIYQAAFVFLVLFAVMVIYNDVAKSVVGWSQRLQ